MKTPTEITIHIDVNLTDHANAVLNGLVAKAIGTRKVFKTRAGNLLLQGLAVGAIEAEYFYDAIVSHPYHRDLKDTGRCGNSPVAVDTDMFYIRFKDNNVFISPKETRKDLPMKTPNFITAVREYNMINGFGYVLTQEDDNFWSFKAGNGTWLAGISIEDNGDVVITYSAFIFSRNKIQKYARLAKRNGNFHIEVCKTDSDEETFCFHHDIPLCPKNKQVSDFFRLQDLMAYSTSQIDDDGTHHVAVDYIR